MNFMCFFCLGQHFVAQVVHLLVIKEKETKPKTFKKQLFYSILYWGFPLTPVTAQLS